MLSHNAGAVRAGHGLTRPQSSVILIAYATPSPMRAGDSPGSAVGLKPGGQWLDTPEVTTIRKLPFRSGHRQLRAMAARSRHLSRPEGPWERFYEGLCYDHRRSLWSAYSGTYLACHRGRPAPGGATFVGSHHRCRRSSLPLGGTVALAPAAVVTGALTRLTCIAADKALWKSPFASVVWAFPVKVASKNQLPHCTCFAQNPSNNPGGHECVASLGFLATARRGPTTPLLAADPSWAAVLPEPASPRGLSTAPYGRASHLARSACETEQLQNER